MHPFAFAAELPPRTASVVADLNYTWSDSDWLQRRARANALDAPMSIYEVHLGSWRRVPEEGNRFLTYRELAADLALGRAGADRAPADQVRDVLRRDHVEVLGPGRQLELVDLEQDPAREPQPSTSPASATATS